DFRKAVHTGTPFVWPYYCYAPYLAETGQFGDCLRISRDGLQRTNDPSMTAEFYELIAISQAGLGESQERAKADFEMARSLAPLNRRIEQNYQLFLRSLGTPATGNPGWNLERERDPDEAALELIRQISNQAYSRTRAA